MFLSKIVSFAAMPLAATSDEIQPWMIAAIAAGALLALILIIVAARKSRRDKGDDLREAMSAAKAEAAQDPVSDWAGIPPEGSDAVEAAQADAVVPLVPATSAKKTPKGKKSGRGKHAR